MQRALAVAASVVATAGAGLALAGTAAAHPLHASPSAITPSGAVVPATPTGTSYEAGYAAAASGNATLTADIQVPILHCQAKDTQPVLPILGLYGQDASANFQESGVSLQLSCQNGDTVDTVTDDSISAGTPVNAGDIIQVSASVTPTSEAQSWTDLTTGASGSTSDGTGFTVSGAQTTVQGGFANPANGPIFPKFSKVSFTQVIVDGTSLALTSPNQYYQQSATGKKQIVSSAITKKTNFVDTWISG